MEVKRLSAKELLDLARSRGLDDEQICKLTNAIPQTVRRWEAGTSEMPRPRRAKVLKAIGA